MGEKKPGAPRWRTDIVLAVATLAGIVLTVAWVWLMVEFALGLHQ